MLKKYFILYGAEKTFLNFQVIFFEKIQTKSQINCKFSKKKNIYKCNKLLDTNPHKKGAIFHWVERKNYFSYSYLVYLD